MEIDARSLYVSTGSDEYSVNASCNYDYVPPAIEYIESLGVFAIVFVSLGAIFTAITIYLVLDVTWTIIYSKETKSWKKNVSIIFFVYPVTSICSLVALAVPRTQLLSEAVTQIYLAMSLYRLYLFLIDVGRREVKKSPSLKLRVGPCCCWPCLPFPDLEMTPTNLSWLQIIVLQLPIVQTLIYCALMFMSVENPMYATRYAIFLQPLSITSILLGLYGLTITTMSLQKARVCDSRQAWSRWYCFLQLQGFVIKSLAGTGLFPCNPPITPKVYSNFTYNALMLIEMVFLCYAARHFYAVHGAEMERRDASSLEAQHPENNNSRPDGDDDDKRHENISERDVVASEATNNNEFEVRSNEPPLGAVTGVINLYLLQKFSHI